MLAMTGAQGAASVQPAGQGAPAVSPTFYLLFSSVLCLLS